jgi:hypothetical protein
LPALPTGNFWRVRQRRRNWPTSAPQLWTGPEAEARRARVEALEVADCPHVRTARSGNPRVPARQPCAADAATCRACGHMVPPFSIPYVLPCDQGQGPITAGPRSRHGAERADPGAHLARIVLRECHSNAASRIPAATCRPWRIAPLSRAGHCLCDQRRFKADGLEYLRRAARRTALGRCASPDAGGDCGWSIGIRLKIRFMPDKIQLA